MPTLMVTCPPRQRRQEIGAHMFDGFCTPVCDPVVMPRRAVPWHNSDERVAIGLTQAYTRDGGHADTVHGDLRPFLGAQRSSRSGLSPASVSGMPRSDALLSAVASSRRMRPATASLVSGGTASFPSSSSDAS